MRMLQVCSVTIFVIFGFVAAFASAAPSTCTKASQEGGCRCDLLDGSGSLDFGPLANSDPLTGQDASGNSYWFTFCNTLDLSDSGPCESHEASACTRKISGDYVNLGAPYTTTFEMRTSPNNPNPRLALVYENFLDPTKVRSVNFLNCNPTVKNPQYLPSIFTNATDPDGDILYFSELIGAQFCPFKPVPACKANKNGTCFCDLIDGSGVLDLRPLSTTTLSAYDGNDDPTIEWGYDLTFCNVLTNNITLKNCYKNASVCQYLRSPPLFSAIIGFPGTTNFVYRKDSAYGNVRLALQAENIAGYSRTAAYLECDKTISKIQFKPYQWSGYQDIDGVDLFELEIRGSQFCPIN